MRSSVSLAILVLAVRTSSAQLPDTVTHDKTFLTRADLGIASVALAGTALLSHWDTQIARRSQDSTFQTARMKSFAKNASKFQETSLTVAGLLTYGIARATGQHTVEDVALHATESVVLASLVSQVIRGPLGRSRPYVTNDTNQYDVSFGGGFKTGEAGFKRRAFPSIHASSSMAVATVLAMELQRRHSSATPYLAPILLAAGLLPGLSRIQLDQHWASDVAAGALMGAFAGYKVVSYSHDHPDNAFDRVLLKATIVPNANGGMSVGFSPF